MPQHGLRIVPTVAGVVLVALAVAIGTAAYNTGSNILFITLPLLLACLVLSGVLSWLNFAGTGWRLLAAPPFRVGQEAIVAVETRNRKRGLSSYALWFEIEAAVAQAHARLQLRERLEPGATRRLEWTFHPARRGVERVRLASVGSLFPFGFLQKSFGADLANDVKVWPARVDYRFAGAAAARLQVEDEEVPRPGAGGDLLGLRRYQAGDSHRHIHWKASARLGQLLIRQNAAERAAFFFLWINPWATLWPRPEQFELLCSFAGSLAEDLFRAARLDGVAVGDEPARPVRCIRDLESFLDQLAELAPTATPGEDRGRSGGPTTIGFEPEGERGICARLDGEIAARV